MFYSFLASLSYRQDLQPIDGPDRSCLQDRVIISLFWETQTQSADYNSSKTHQKRVQFLFRYHFAINGADRRLLWSFYLQMASKFNHTIFEKKICKPKINSSPHPSFKKTSNKFFHVSCLESPVFHQVISKSRVYHYCISELENGCYESKKQSVFSRIRHSFRNINI